MIFVAFDHGIDGCVKRPAQRLEFRWPTGVDGSSLSLRRAEEKHPFRLLFGDARSRFVDGETAFVISSI